MAITLPITPDTVTRTKLSNGIVVLVKDNPHYPSVTLRGRFRAGALYDTAKTAGLANFTTLAMQRGTRKRAFQKQSAELDRRAMAFNVGAGTETISFSGKSLVDDFDRLLDIAADVFMHPTFPRAEIEKLRREMLNSLKTAESNTRYVALREFRALCYPESHPYHRLAGGQIDTVKRLTLDALQNFHDCYFRPDVLTLTIVGNIRTERAIEKIERALGKWKTRGAMPDYDFPDVPPLAQQIRKQTPVAGKTQIDFMLGAPSLRRNDPDFYALSLADFILGRLGLRGRLGTSVRDKQGLAYSVSTNLEANIATGPWTMGAGVNPKNLERAIDAMLIEIKRMRDEPVTQAELDEAKEHAIGSLALRLETNDGIAAAMTDIDLFGLGLDYLQRYPDIVRAITLEQIQAVMHKYAPVDQYVLSIAGPVS